MVLLSASIRSKDQPDIACEVEGDNEAFLAVIHFWNFGIYPNGFKTVI